MSALSKHKRLILVFLIICVLGIALYISKDKPLSNNVEELADNKSVQEQEHLGAIATEQYKTTGFGRMKKSIESEDLETLAKDILQKSDESNYTLHAADYIDLFSSHWMCVYEKDFGSVEMVYIRELEEGRCEVTSYEIDAGAERFRG